MSCEQRPSVTLWGTTQITTLTTVLSTRTNPNAHRITSSVTSTTCDGEGNCGPVARPTVIVDEADLSFETVTTQTVVTNVIPVQTRYYPCPSETTSPPQPQSTGTSAPAMTSTSEPAEGSLTISTVPAPDTTSSGPSTSSPASQSSSASPTSLTLSPSSDDQAALSSSTSDEPPASVAWPTVAEETSSPPGAESITTTGQTGNDGSALGGESSSKSSALGANEIVGIVLGCVTLLVFLGLMIVKYRSRRKDRKGGGGHQETYWERRFQELEGGGEKSVEGITPTSPPEDEGTHHKHLTLNLASHHPTINRPASRLSQISSFFGGSGGVDRPSPEPSRFALLRNRDAIDFSRPREDGDGDRFSFKSFGKAASVKSTRSSRAPALGGGGSERRTSNWPFTGVAAAIAGSIKGRPGSVKSTSQESDHHLRPAGTGNEGRKGMEWIRTIVSSDSGFGFNRDPNSTSPSNGRGLPPPPRSRGVSPLPHLSETATANAGNGQPRLSAFPEARPDDSAPAPPMYEPRSEDLPLAAAQSGSSGRQLYPSNSLRKKRQHKGLAVPDLELNRDAISPNLWIDDETLDRFGRGQLSPRRRSRDQHAIANSNPTAPLAISKKPRPPAPPAPSAFNAAELMSRFSPDSSRGSFSTLQQERPRRTSQTSGKDLPSMPATHSTPRVGGCGGPDVSGGTEQRRFERSAVTPQLPSLATSNADAFRAEMAELSDTTGESERVERVVSVHESK